MGNKKSDKEKHYNWLMGADMYLATSVILCDEILKSYRFPKKLNCLNNIQKIDKKCGFTSANPDYEILMPIIFNLKHGIELYLKALIMQINLKQEYPQSHDLLFLLNNLIIEIKKIKPKAEDVLNTLDKKMRPKIEKYYFGLYAFSQYKINPDSNNEAERYPEYRNYNCYKVEKLYEIVSIELLNEIRKDIVAIQEDFRENIFLKIC